MLCTLCGTCESKPGRKRCYECAAKIAAQQWRWKQGQPKKARPVRKTHNLATDHLIVAHMPLAKAIARRAVVKYRLQDGSDVVGDALYGLVVAGRTFDESKGVPFAAWARKEIQGAVYNELNKQWRRMHINEQVSA
jgi:DNA-directed RNA polymerase specialized sigma subunit